MVQNVKNVHPSVLLVLTMILVYPVMAIELYLMSLVSVENRSFQSPTQNYAKTASTLVTHAKVP